MAIPRMSRQHFEFLADELGSAVAWPTGLHAIADVLAKTNPSFDRDRFLKRATDRWEETHALEEIDDHIPY